MTATFTDPVVPRSANGDIMERLAWSRGAWLKRDTTPGTLWERVAEGHAVYRSPRPYSAADKAQAAVRLVRVSSESIPERTERIIHEQNVGFGPAVRVALAESRLERAKAAHPAGKGRRTEDA